MNKRNDNQYKNNSNPTKSFDRLVGVFHANRRGFGFVTPQNIDGAEDLFVPLGQTSGAMSNDLVEIEIYGRGKKGNSYKVVTILERGQTHVVGTLEKRDKTWLVRPDGKQLDMPVSVSPRLPHNKEHHGEAVAAGSKVSVEIIGFPEQGNTYLTGIITEVLGQSGQIAVETAAIIRMHKLPHEFSTKVLEEAKQVAERLSMDDTKREDLTSKTIITIDPNDARDFDDAISIDRNGDETILGVHIADVSHFVQEGSALDEEATLRGTSIYFPHKVIPMLPEVLSNGVCSLQEGQRRLTKSAFITYNDVGEVINTRFAETVICSSKRLTYEQAQDICDSKPSDCSPEVMALVGNMETLSRRIEKRRNQQGMIHLELPDVELIFGEDGTVTDAEPEDDAYTHTIIEMFMVEANEAIARLFNKLNIALIRRIHPKPDEESFKKLEAFIRACGLEIPVSPTLHDIGRLIKEVSDKDQSYPVNLAILRSFTQAEYSIEPIGHYALASDHYCHFTSPIRRYPDLFVHRMLALHCRGQLQKAREMDKKETAHLADHCSMTERRAESSENELRKALILQYLSDQEGEAFKGVITGVTDRGIFVQWPRFMVDGMLKLQDLGGEPWDVSARYGMVRGDISGTVYRIGQIIEVRIAKVDVAKREMNLVPAHQKKKVGPSNSVGNEGRPPRRRQKDLRSSPPKRRGKRNRNRS